MKPISAPYHSGIVALPLRVRAVGAEAEAARAAERRIALQSHVGPHVGPGSGAPLNFMISRMRSRMEKLEAFSDESEGESEH